MSRTQPMSRPAAQERSVPLLVAAALVVVAVVAAVLAFGVERPPGLEPLTPTSPLTPPGSIAWTVWTGDEPCLLVADERGGVREVVCGQVVRDEVVGWTAEGIVLREFLGDEAVFAAVDPATGGLVELERAFGNEDHGAEVSVRSERGDGTLRVSVGDDLGDRTEVWVVEAPPSYDVVSATPSPDGGMLALTDTAGRLLVVPSDGSEAPRLWSDEVERYGRLVWEGADPSREG